MVVNSIFKVQMGYLAHSCLVGELTAASYEKQFFLQKELNFSA